MALGTTDIFLPRLPTGQAQTVRASALWCSDPDFVNQARQTMTTSALLSIGLVLGPLTLTSASHTGQPTCTLEKLHFTDTQAHKKLVSFPQLTCK